MKTLNEQELLVTAGGASHGTVDIKVTLNFNGRAAEAVANVDAIPFTFHYGDKSVASKIYKVNNWEEDIVQVPKGIEFWIEMDFSPWPQITEANYEWNKASNTMHYEIY